MEKEVSDGERPKPKRYIYNPFLLNCVYQKIDYACRLRQLYVWRVHRHCDKTRGMDPEERYRLIKENLYGEQVVADLFHLCNAMREEKFPIDLYHCNYEHALYRLYCVLLSDYCRLDGGGGGGGGSRTNDSTKFPPGWHHDIDGGGSDVTQPLLMIEQKLIEVLSTCCNEEGAEANRFTLLGVLDRYVGRHYFLTLVNYDDEAVKRHSLLFNTKHRIEEEVRKKQRDDPDYAIEYNREVVLSMLYVHLANELLALCQEEGVQVRTAYQTYKKPHSDEAYEKCQRKIRRCEQTIGLVQEVAQCVWDQFHDEFFGFSFATITAFPNSCRHTSDNVVRRYIMPQPSHQKTVSRLKDVSTGDFVINEKQCSHIHYIALRKNREQYEFVARKMLFDHLLLLSHRDSCPCSSTTISNYARTCQVCRYMQRVDSLGDLYAASSAHTYYLCEYVVTSYNSNTLASKQTQEDLLMRCLHGMIVDPLMPLTALIYKNAMQAMVLFSDFIGGGATNLFHVVEAGQIFQYVIERYVNHDGHEPDAREAVILMNAQRNPVVYGSGSTGYDIATGKSKAPLVNASRVEKWQKKLARDIDVYTLLMLAVNAQQSDIEKYERSLCVESVNLNLSKILIEIYGLYVNVLDDTLKKIY